MKIQGSTSSSGINFLSYSLLDSSLLSSFDSGFNCSNNPVSEITEKRFLKTVYEGKETSIVIEQNVSNPKVMITTPLETLTKTVQELSVKFKQMQESLGLLKTGNVLIVQDSLKEIWDNEKDEFWNGF